MNFKHGHAKKGKISPEFKTWTNIKARCYDVNNISYFLYGAKGVKVCDRWLDSFENFLCDMGERPSARHSIDRFPNKSGDYELINCRWATIDQQANNKTNNVMLTYDGVTKTLSEWARIKKIQRQTISVRINEFNWSIAKALEVPVRRCIEYNGISKTMSEWAVEMRVPIKILSQRLKNGMSLHRALTKPSSNKGAREIKKQTEIRYAFGFIS